MAIDPSQAKFETLALHGGQEVDPTTRSRAVTRSASGIASPWQTLFCWTR